jgi:hypothetical protein
MRYNKDKTQTNVRIFTKKLAVKGCNPKKWVYDVKTKSKKRGEEKWNCV